MNTPARRKTEMWCVAVIISVVILFALILEVWMKMRF